MIQLTNVNGRVKMAVMVAHILHVQAMKEGQPGGCLIFMTSGQPLACEESFDQVMKKINSDEVWAELVDPLT